MNETLKEAVKAIKTAILKSQAEVLRTANGSLLSLYFGIGRYVSNHSREGTWGTGAIDAISEQLQKEMPGLRGFGARNIRNMRQFYEFWSPKLTPQPTLVKFGDNEIVSVNTIWQMLSAKLDAEVFLSVGFASHIDILSKTKDVEEYFFYLTEAHRNKWTNADLRIHLKADDYHRVGTLPNNFTSTIESPSRALAAVKMFKDEYLLDFINVEDIEATSGEDVNERVLENGIVAHIKNFIMTFGRDFTFVGNQFRMEVEGHEQFVDLLFFNRELNSLVAVELKAGEFKSAYLGQLHLYLQILEDQFKKPHENPPIGIILCKSADKAFVEYAVRDYDRPMGVATYRTADEMPERLRRALPPIEEMRKMLECDAGEI